LLSFVVLGVAAIIQTAVFVLSGSVALLADLIHNFGDAQTAGPLGIASSSVHDPRSASPGCSSSQRSSPAPAWRAWKLSSDSFTPARLVTSLVLAVAGVVGYGGNWVAAQIRTRAGGRLDSPALIADGNHARADAYVSLAIVASAVGWRLGLLLGTR
jgi:divalent metal cation (Fe/Co/Zn/Cd) transporter